MKLLIAFFFAGLLGASASTYSQQTKFNFKLDDASVKEVFKLIEEKSEFVFFYNEDFVDVNRKVNIDVTDQKVESILDELFKGTKNSYKIYDRQIVILTKSSDDEPSVASSESIAPQKKEINGKVTDNKGVPLPGVSIVVMGTTIGTVTDIDGQFNLKVPIEAKSVVFSFIGMVTQEIAIDSKTVVSIILLEQTVGLEEVVAVGYGVQKKASVVGAITTTTNKELARTGGVNTLGMALTGNLPGLTTIQLTGQPGSDKPIIYIRGQGTWNGGQPYILVDGVERNMNDLDISEVDNISVLKDASATAVYGVKGANGVILITTKRGAKGKPSLTVSANSTMKIPSRIFDKPDSYDMYLVKNAAIERGVVISESMWPDYTPFDIVQRYRNQQNLKYPEAYPNVNWKEETFKDFAMDHHVSLNLAGGNDFTKYFSFISFTKEGDLFKNWDNNKGYTAGYSYDRLNVRTNLDLNLTKTTSLKLNLSGMYGVQKKNVASMDGTENTMASENLLAYFRLGSNAFLPRYADGRWGTNPDTNMKNSIASLVNSGYDLNRRTELTSDISITQKLDFITRGLSAYAGFSFDNRFESTSGITDQLATSYPSKYIYPEIEDAAEGEDLSKYILLLPATGINQFSWNYQPWTIRDEVPNQLFNRRLYYQAQLNYARVFGKHDLTATGVLTREQYAAGSEFQHFREDWVFRATNNYDNRYMVEFNGAYNGSEKFGSDYRFAFFPSAAVGWTISNEKFMEKYNKWLDKLKFRFSYGLIGDDSGLSQRWIYNSQYIYSGKQNFDEFANSTIRSPYTIFRESSVGNPDIHWEKARKSNFGLELAVLKNMFSANIEYFTEDRTDILLLGSSRTVPVYYGKDAPTANLGRVTKKGYEGELRFNKNLHDWHFWANASITHAVDKVIYKEEPELLDSYRKAQGFQINQTKTIIATGYMNNWNEVYGNAPLSSYNPNQLPGEYSLIDFDSDGIIDLNKDYAPYGYPNRPQNNYNLSFGADYRGFSVTVQFYGVNNVTRRVFLKSNFQNGMDMVYQSISDVWAKDNPDAGFLLPWWNLGGQQDGQSFLYDGSYLRLKTAELAYTFTSKGLKQAGMSSVKLYLNGNNLIFWSKLPDDREQELTGVTNVDIYGAYPTSKRINLGIDIKF